MRRRSDECLHYQLFWWCLEWLSGIPSSKGPRGDNFPSKNTDQLKQKKRFEATNQNIKNSKALKTAAKAIQKASIQRFKTVEAKAWRPLPI